MQGMFLSDSFKETDCYRLSSCVVSTLRPGPCNKEAESKLVHQCVIVNVLLMLLHFVYPIKSVKE